MKKEPLTPRQRLGIEYAIAHPFFNKPELAAACETTVATVNHWFRDELFLNEWDKLLLKTWKNSIRSAQVKMAELAKDGDYRANEFILKSGGFNDTTKLELDSKKIVVSIEEDNK